VLFLRRAKKSRLGRIPLQPWVEETTVSPAEERIRQNFQADWSALKQHAWLIRNHKKNLHEYHVYM
jgi:hypothetical protein